MGLRLGRLGRDDEVFGSASVLLDVWRYGASKSEPTQACLLAGGLKVAGERGSVRTTERPSSEGMSIDGELLWSVGDYSSDRLLNDNKKQTCSDVPRSIAFLFHPFDHDDRLFDQGTLSMLKVATMFHL